MKENRREMLKMSITLMVYTLIAGIALGLVYTITKDRIAEAELANVISSMESLLTDENGNAIVSVDEIKKIVLSKRNEMGNVLFTDSVGTVIAPVYEFETDSAKYYLLTGYAVGYGGNVVTMAAFQLDKTTGELSLKAIKVLDYSQETPGLGAKIADPNVQKRFFPIPETGLSNGLKVDKDAGKQGIDPEEAKQEGVVKVSDVMTGATITPRAVVSSLNAMYKFLKEKYLGGEM
ncbi:RnfABCDGE type electron transport complex subunit G [Fervidobacterium pennivorans subsp. shakshaketiis]|jgi:electron transport complex protein RnfG|uniref:Ion-translocating oxidoreductase complex subunit G n=1 Tax=Fervidobacterium pennivorans (strain DSM 9078 / Ven5) TaxID=771875 RepID=H9U9Z6_FERPD|nr:RnfABCDGE type electron transport complex subunit G [Fervidobacterium pennivorans]AFG34339.1 electron transport complex, RnfABCDGE type, G subunit [Fervidobacterium pennivorans DSM 9078]QIV77698.1 RnfABCDGE type electron transport complex subunit G [Fervidobacterium pennivorans subsp. keratinolyticus]